MQSVCLFYFIIFSRCRKSALLRRWLVTSRQSWEADWFARAVFRSRALGRAKYVAKYKTVMVLACQVGPFHLTLTQINSEMNCIAKNKCPEDQKLGTRRRGENLNAMSRATRCIFLHSLSLIYSMWCKKSVRKSYFSFWNKVLFCRMFVLLLERVRSVIRSEHSAGRACGLLFNRSSKAFVKNADPVRRTLWKLYWFIALVICGLSRHGT